MKMDFHRAAVLAVMALGLNACGTSKTVSTTYSTDSSEDCSSAAMSTQYMVRFEDGTIGVVKAGSEKEFLDGFLTKNLKRVRYAEPDYRVKSATLPVAARDIQTASYADNWGVLRVAPDALWQQNIRGGGVIVAIVDSGMDLTHPQLAKQLAYNPGEQGFDESGHDRGSNGKDDDGNGYVDDVQGWDFTVNKPIAGDNTYHGTHVAGIIAAAHSDTVSGPGDHVEGIAPSAKILPLAFLGSDGSGSMSDGVRAIQYAVARGARVINASWGGAQCSRTLRDELSGLSAKGVIFVAAAGNESSDVDSSPEYPASLNVAAQITVGATGDHDYMADYSNFGDKSVHIFAPGSDIMSTLPGGKIGSLSGTSMATPFVTGAIALLISAEPTANVDQIRQALYNTAVKRTDYINASQGRMNLNATVSELRRQMGKMKSAPASSFWRATVH